MLTVFLTAGMACAAWAQILPAELNRAQEEYNGKIRQVQADSASRQAALPEQYVRALTASEAAFMAKGDLEAVLALRAERERFSRDTSIPDAALASNAPPVRDLQVQFRSARARFEKDMHGSVLALAGAHVARLGSLEADLTRQGRIDDALAVRKAAEAVRASPAYTRAEFALAEAAPSPVSPAGGTSSPPPALPAESPAPAWSEVGGPGVTIADEDKLPPESARAVARRLDATPTARGRLLNRLTVRLYAVGRNTRDGNRECVRTCLGLVSRDRPVAKPTLVVDYYAKSDDASGRMTARDLTKVRSEIIRIPNLTGDRRLAVDAAGIAAEWDLHGVLVTVFDEQNRVVYQAATRPSLRDLAVDSPPAEPYETQQRPPSLQKDADTPGNPGPVVVKVPAGTGRSAPRGGRTVKPGGRPGGRR